MSVYEKLMKMQAELKAPKNQYNKFGNFYYRAFEDILEAVKPLNAKYGVVLTIGDEIVEIANRFYVKATVTLVDIGSGEKITNTAYAREDDAKKGMDGSQITGTASSYARKYCLNGLFCIDDNKDADTDEYCAQQERKPQPQQQKQKPKAQPQATGDKFVKITPQGNVIVTVASGHDENGRPFAAYKNIKDLTIEELEKMITIPQYTLAHAAIKALLEETRQTA